MVDSSKSERCDDKDLTNLSCSSFEDDSTDLLTKEMEKFSLSDADVGWENSSVWDYLQNQSLNRYNSMQQAFFEKYEQMSLENLDEDFDLSEIDKPSTIKKIDNIRSLSEQIIDMPIAQMSDLETSVYSLLSKKIRRKVKNRPSTSTCAEYTSEDLSEVKIGTPLSTSSNLRAKGNEKFTIDKDFGEKIANGLSNCSPSNFINFNKQTVEFLNESSDKSKTKPGSIIITELGENDISKDQGNVLKRTNLQNTPLNKKTPMKMKRSGTTKEIVICTVSKNSSSEEVSSDNELQQNPPIKMVQCKLTGDLKQKKQKVHDDSILTKSPNNFQSTSLEYKRVLRNRKNNSQSGHKQSVDKITLKGDKIKTETPGKLQELSPNNKTRTYETIGNKRINSLDKMSGEVSPNKKNKKETPGKMTKQCPNSKKKDRNRTIDDSLGINSNVLSEKCKTASIKVFNDRIVSPVLTSQQEPGSERLRCRTFDNKLRRTSSRSMAVPLDMSSSKDSGLQQSSPEEKCFRNLQEVSGSNSSHNMMFSQKTSKNSSFEIHCPRYRALDDRLRSHSLHNMMVSQKTSPPSENSSLQQLSPDRALEDKFKINSSQRKFVSLNKSTFGFEDESTNKNYSPSFAKSCLDKSKGLSPVEFRFSKAPWARNPNYLKSN